MNLSNDKDFIKNLEHDIENLSKTLYLNNPDLWLDFLEKASDKEFDEMSLFFAAKYNYVSIIRFAVETNKFDLNGKSKNPSFNCIKNHLIDAAKLENSIDVLNYLNGEKENTSLTKNNTSLNNDDLSVSYNCPHCNNNIYKCGYKVLISSNCTYSNESKKIVRLNPTELDYVICNNCNTKIETVTPSQLEALITVENCSTCGVHLPTTGILKEINSVFNNSTKKFEDTSSTFCCKACRKPLENNQLKHFNLD